ncbi:MAG: LUD domain-containing protein [Mediterranea sp.]|jgi:L-lactate dehydrogenase complex protein LldG|nr:LUD domain-containing protein [Mediterranea sp.]
MSSKEEILAKIKENTPQQTYDLPDLSALQGITYGDKVAQWAMVMRQVGGEAVPYTAADDLNALIRQHYPDARVIASNLPEVNIATLNPDHVADPHELNGTDLAIVRGELGVLENGCVWLPQNVKEKALYFIAEYLVILLREDQLVNNMHEAYRRISLNDYGFGTFISGPSKTADIEQALVVGAHGARGVTVFLETSAHIPTEKE